MYNLLRYIINNDQKAIQELQNLTFRTTVEIPVKIQGTKLRASRLYPLHMCVYFGRPEIAAILLKAGANPNALDVTNNWAPIHYAAFLNDLEFVNLLKKEGADVDCPGNIGETALHVAATNNLLEMARLLIELGADVNRQNTMKKTTPLHIALNKENTKMMALLLKHQADPSLGNSDNVTVTQLVQELNKPEFSQLLDGSSPLLQMSDEELTQGSSKTRIEDYEDPSKIDIPQQNGADPYARYKDPQSVLDHLNRKTFEDIPQDQRVLQNLQHRDTFKPKVQEVKSKRLTPQQRKKQKWTRTTGGQEREKMQQAQNENEEKIDLDALLEEAEMSALQEQEKNNKKGNKNKPNQTQQSKQAQSTSKPIQKEAPKSPEQPKAETKTQNHQTCKTTSEPKSKPAVNNQNTAEPKGKEKAPIARGRKIKKTLKRVSSSSSDDEENQENEIDDDIVVLPSYHNKVSTKQNLPNETAQEEPKQTVSNDSTQQPTSQSSSLSVEEYHNLTKMLFENNKMLTQQQQLLIQQLMAQHQAAYPFYPYMPPPQPMQPPMPSGQMQQPSPSAPMHQQMPFPPMQPPIPNMYPYMIQPPMSPSPIMNVTTDDFQTLAAKVASLEQILAPVLRQSKMNQGQPLGICQNCNMQSATSVCPKCGRVFCTSCRHIHIDQQCA